MRPLFRKSFRLLIVVAVIGALVLAWSFAGLHHYRIKSGSMDPVLPIGSLILVAPEANLAKGDIITFRSDDGAVTTHIFLGYNNDGSVITQGYANLSRDNFNVPIQKSAVIGKLLVVTKIFTLGFWLTPNGIGILLLSLVIVFAVRMDDKKPKHALTDKETSPLSPV